MDTVKIAAMEAVLKGVPEEGVIELKALYFKDAKCRVEPTKDRLTGRLIGVPRLSDEDKKQLTFYTEPTTYLWIKHGYTFDMSIPEQRLLWAMVQPSPLVGKNRQEAENTPGCRFFINNEDVEVREEMQHEDDMFKALTFIHNDKDSELIARARLLGVDMTGSSPTVAKKWLLKTLREKDGAKVILDLYNSSTVATTLVFFKAVDKGIIKQTNGIYMYGTMPIGADDNTVIEFLQSPSNSALLEQVKIDINPELFGEAAPKSKSGSREKAAANTNDKN